MRLLLALSGGQDGYTFRMEDPTRVAHEVSFLCGLMLKVLIDWRWQAFTIVCVCDHIRSHQEKRVGELGSTSA